MTDKLENWVLMVRSGMLCIAVIVATLAPASHASNKALLVGISDYPNLTKLYGPENDVDALAKLLTGSSLRSPYQVNVLLNENATKANILSAIEKLIEESDVDDTVLIYFSGHGTSAHDLNISAPMSEHTGALIPYDIQNISSMSELLERIVIGERDLRPLFRRLDRTVRQVNVIVDACYSGNTVRSFMSLPTRYVNLSQLIQGTVEPEYALTMTQKPDASAVTRGFEFSDYPYENLFYFAASSPQHVAEDIPPHRLQDYPTFDGRAHGAFTDSLLTVLSRNLNALTYASVVTETKELMKRRGFKSAPEFLPKQNAGFERWAPQFAFDISVNSNIVASE